MVCQEAACKPVKEKVTLAVEVSPPPRSSDRQDRLLFELEVSSRRRTSAAMAGRWGPTATAVRRLGENTRAATACTSSLRTRCTRRARSTWE